MDKAKAGTFILNMGEPVHRWYSYIEGYSSCLVSRELDILLDKGNRIETLYEPFSGTGTTGIVASTRGISPFYSESNPFMQFVTETKVNSVVCGRSKEIEKKLNECMRKLEGKHVLKTVTWDGFEKYFEPHQLGCVLAIKKEISKESDWLIKNILMLALSSIIVKCSKMIRRGDLRYATDKEYKRIDVYDAFFEKLQEIILDVYTYEGKIKCPIIKVSDDARMNNERDKFDCVITSPPYLNGTNYIRNTKLELKLNDFVISEKELPSFHSKGIIAGINNVSKRSGERAILEEVKPFMDELTEKSYDERIPKMVIGYFYDMNDMLRNLAISIRTNGHFIMDIGDSQFAGVHIPTHEILSTLCEKHGLIKYEEDILRERRSKNGMILSQRILRFRKER